MSSSTPSRTNIASKYSATSLRLIRPVPVGSSTANENQSAITSSLPYESSPSTNTTPDSNSENKNQYDDNNSNLATTEFTATKAPSGQKQRPQDKSVSKKRANATKTMNSNNDDILEEVIVDFDHQLTKIAASVSPIRSRPGLVLAGVTRGNNTNKLANKASTVLNNATGNDGKVDAQTDDKKTSAIANTGAIKTIAASSRSVFGNRYHRAHTVSNAVNSTSASAISEDKESDSTATLNDEIATAAANTAGSIIDELRNPSNNDINKGRKLNSRSAAITPHRRRNTSLPKPTSTTTVAVASATLLVPSSLETSGAAVSSTSSTCSTTSSTALRPSYRLAASLLSSTFADPSTVTTDQVSAKTEAASSKPNSITATGTSGIRQGKTSYKQNNRSLVLASLSTATTPNDEANFVEEKKDEDRSDVTAASTKTPTSLVSITTPSSSALVSTTLRYSRYARNIKKKTSTAITSKQTTIAANSPSTENSSISSPAPEPPTTSTSEPTMIDVATKPESDFVATNGATSTIDEQFCEFKPCNTVGTKEALTSPAPTCEPKLIALAVTENVETVVNITSLTETMDVTELNNVSQKMESPELGGCHVELDEVHINLPGTAVSPVGLIKEQNTQEQIDEGSIKMATGTLVNNANASKCTDEDDVYVPPSRSRFDIVAASNESWLKQTQLKKRAIEESSASKAHTETVLSNKNTTGSSSDNKAAKATLESKLGNNYLEVSKDLSKSHQASQPVNEMISTRFSSKDSNTLNGATGRIKGISEYNGNRLRSPEAGAIQLNGRIGVDDGLIRQSTGKVPANSNELVVASWRNRLKSSNGHDEGFQSATIGQAPVQCKVDALMADQKKIVATSKNKVTIPNDDDQTDRSVGNVLAVWRTRIGTGSDDISNGPRSLSKPIVSTSTLTATKSPSIGDASADLKVAQIGPSFAQNHRNSSFNSPAVETSRCNDTDVPKFVLRQTASDTADQINQTDKKTMKVKQVESLSLSRPINRVNNGTCDQGNLSTNGDVQHLPPLADAEDHFSQRVSESGSYLTEQLSGDTECVSVASRRQMLLQRMNGGIAADSSHSTTGSAKKSAIIQARCQQEVSQEIAQNKNVVLSSRSVADATVSGSSLVKGAATGTAMHSAKKGIAQKWRQWEEANLNGTPGTRFQEEVKYSSRLTQHQEETRDIPNMDSYASSYTSINSFGPIDEIPSEISPQSSGDYCNRPSQFKMSTSSSLGSNDHIVHKKPVATEVSLNMSSNANKIEVKNPDQQSNNLKTNQRQGLKNDNSVAVCTSTTEGSYVVTGSDTSVSARKAQLWAPNGGLIVSCPSTHNETTVDKESTSDGTKQTEPNDEINKQRSQESDSVENMPSNDTTESGNSLDYEGFNTSLRVIPNRADVSTPIGMSPPQRGERIEAVPMSISLEGQQEDNGCKETVKSRFNINETASFPSVGNKIALPRKGKANDNDISSSSGHSQGNSKRNQERKSIKDSILSWMSDSFRTSSRRLTNKDENDLVIASNEVSTNPEVGVEISQPLLTAYDDTQQHNAGVLVAQSPVTEDFFVPAKPPKHNGSGQYSMQLSQLGSQPNIERAHESLGNISVPLHRSVSLGDFQENISPEKNGLSSDNGNSVCEANNIQFLTVTISGLDDGFPTAEGSTQTSLLNLDEDGFVAVNASSTPNLQSSWNALVRKEDRPWNKDQRTLSPELWQKKKKGIDFEAALLNQSGHSHNMNDRIETSIQNAAGVPPSTVGEQCHVTTTSTGSPLVSTKETAQNNMESLRSSQSPSSATSAIFGNPEAFGPTRDEGESFPSLSVTQANTLAKSKGGLGVPSRPIVKQDIIRKEICRSLSPITRGVSTQGDVVTNAANHGAPNNRENHITHGISVINKQIPEERHWNSGDADFGIPVDYEIFDAQPLSSSLISKENEMALNDDKLHGWSTEEIPEFPFSNHVSAVKHPKEADIFDPFSSMDDNVFLPRTQAIPDVERHISTPVENQLSSRSQNLQNNDAGRYTAKTNLDRVSSIAVVKDHEPESFAANDPFSPESVSSFMVPRVELASLKKNLSVFDPFSSDEAYEIGNDVLFEDDPDMFKELFTVYPKQQHDTSVSNEFFSDDFFVPQNFSRRVAKSGYEADQSCLHESNFEI